MKMKEAPFLECLSYEDENKKISCLYLHWTCKYLSLFNPPRPVVNISTGIAVHQKYINHIRIISDNTVFSMKEKRENT